MNAVRSPKYTSGAVRQDSRSASHSAGWWTYQSPMPQRASRVRTMTTTAMRAAQRSRLTGFVFFATLAFFFTLPFFLAMAISSLGLVLARSRRCVPACGSGMMDTRALGRLLPNPEMEDVSGRIMAEAWRSAESSRCRAITARGPLKNPGVDSGRCISATYG